MRAIVGAVSCVVFFIDQLLRRRTLKGGGDRMSAQAQVSDTSAPALPRVPWREVSAASVGNALEFYDLVIYGYFAVVISKLFFPAANETVSLMLAVGTFGISFLID